MIKNVAEIELPMHACRLSCRTGISICIPVILHFVECAHFCEYQNISYV